MVAQKKKRLKETQELACNNDDRHVLELLYSFQHHPGSSEPGERCVIFSLVRHVKIPKSVVSLSLKWVPMSKAMAQHSGRAGGKSSKHHHLDAPLPSPTSGMDQLCYSIREQIIFQQVSHENNFHRLIFI